MSRHKNIRNMNLDAELNDYDAEDYEDADDISEEDQRQLREGLKSVRQTLGHDIPGLKDAEIEETLWYYYFDVPKTVSYILNTHGVKQTKQQQQPKKGGSPESISTSSASGKVSKIAALARAKKEKILSQTQEVPTGSAKTSVSLLERLQKSSPKAPLAPPTSTITASTTRQSHPQTRHFLPQQAELKGQSTANVKAPSDKISVASSSTETTGPAPPLPPKLPAPSPYTPQGLDQPEKRTTPAIAAPPSAFAKSMFGDRFELHRTFVFADLKNFTLLGNTKAAKAVAAAAQAFEKPSPDEVVAAAQKNSGWKGAKKAEEAKNPNPEPAQTPPPPPVAKIDVLKEYKESLEKENINFVVVGHVDAGKSTLMGRILLDCGAVDEKVIRKYRQEAEQIGKGSFTLAWVLDQTQEERTRGVTIDTATNRFETKKAAFTILDAPGHRDFIPNMIAGAAQADFAVLVIDASTGAFEAGFHLKGQTKEHTLLVRSMGVQKVVVAVNKLDTVGWSEERFQEIVQQMTQFLTNAGFNMKNVAFIPCSGLEGVNVLRKPDKNLIPWYTGPTLLEQLGKETSNKYTRAVEKPLRLTVSDVFKSGPQNYYTISGRIEGGYLQEGEQLVSLPSKVEVVARALFINDEPRKWAVAGHNVSVYLSGTDMDLRPGDVLCKPSAPLIPLKIFNVKLLAFQNVTPMGVDILRGQLHAAGRIKAMLATYDKATGEVLKRKPRHIAPGALASVTVELAQEASVPVEAGNRIVLRANGDTVAAGIIEANIK